LSPVADGFPNRYVANPGNSRQGVGSDEAARLADSFRFDACLKRERLLDILRSAATA
jgi:hypothetical protein